MGWNSGKKRFYCEECEEDLEAKAKVLLQHIEEHKEISQAITEGREEDFGDMALMIKAFKVKLWQVDLKSTNGGLNLQLLNYRRL